MSDLSNNIILSITGDTNKTRAIISSDICKITKEVNMNNTIEVPPIEVPPTEVPVTEDISGTTYITIDLEQFSLDLNSVNHLNTLETIFKLTDINNVELLSSDNLDTIYTDTDTNNKIQLNNNVKKITTNIDDTSIKLFTNIESNQQIPYGVDDQGDFIAYSTKEWVSNSDTGLIEATNNDWLESSNTNIDRSVCILSSLVDNKGQLTFRWKAETEKKWDYFMFAITEEGKPTTWSRTNGGENSLHFEVITGSTSWEDKTIDLSLFETDKKLHLHWVYFKDWGSSADIDTVYLDNIQLTNSESYEINDYKLLYTGSSDSLEPSTYNYYYKNGDIKSNVSQIKIYEKDIVPENTMTIKFAFHVIQNDRTWTDELNNQLTEQIEVLKSTFLETSPDMLDNGGGVPMKFTFEILKNPNHTDTNLTYYNIIDPSSEHFNPEWVTGTMGKILGDGEDTAATHYGVNYGIDTSTINVFIAEGDETSWDSFSAYASFPESSFGTKSYGMFMHTYALALAELEPGTEPFSKGHTFTHEVGHLLGLQHTFDQDGNGDAENGDFISDTPKHPEPNMENYLDSSGNYYPNNSEEIPNSNLNSEGRDPVYNYMNYSWDSSTHRFTNGQLYRMWIMMQEYCPGIWNTGNPININNINNNSLSKKLVDKSNIKIKYNNNIQNFYKSSNITGRCGCKTPIHFDLSKCSNCYENKEVRQLIKQELLIRKKVGKYLKKK